MPTPSPTSLLSVSSKYEYRFRFDSRKQPENYEGDPYIFFGVSNISLRVETEYYQYCQTWQKPLESCTNVQFWMANIDRFPNLYKVAMYWANYCTSSICAERAIGKARNVDVPNRGSMGWDTFTNELKLRVNRPFLESLCAEKLKEANGNNSSE